VGDIKESLLSSYCIIPPEYILTPKTDLSLENISGSGISFSEEVINAH
jgi:hypothetical protein